MAGILVLSEDGSWKVLATADVGGMQALVVTSAPPTTFFNIPQPEGGWVKIGAVESAGVLTLCVAG